MWKGRSLLRTTGRITPNQSCTLYLIIVAVLVGYCGNFSGCLFDKGFFNGIIDPGEKQPSFLGNFCPSNPWQVRPTETREVAQLIFWGRGSATNARWLILILCLIILTINWQVESCPKKIECQNKCRSARCNFMFNLKSGAPHLAGGPLVLLDFVLCNLHDPCPLPSRANSIMRTNTITRVNTKKRTGGIMYCRSLI